jgi:2-methylcitrate dehydratase PrpD
MSILSILVKHIVDTDYKALPVKAVEATKKQVLDTLAVTVAGSTCNVANEMTDLVDMVKSWGGKEESTIIAFGGKVPAQEAAFINGTLCERWNFDDTHDIDRIHPSRAVVPPAFALAERKGRVAGKELITAIALGYDLECRLKLAVGQDIESEFGFVSNYFGAAATSGKILGLNEEKMKYALGRAFNQISGVASTYDMFGFGKGASAEGIENGFTVKAGIISAFIAEKCFTSSEDFLEEQNRNNFYKLFYNGYFNPQLLTLNLGTDFRGASGSQKAYPCCHFQQTSVDATLTLVKEYGIKLDDVAEIVPHVGPMTNAILGSPLEWKQNPQNVFHMAFSLPWVIASAIVYGKVGIPNFTGQALNDKRIHELAHKVTPVIDLGYARRRVSEPVLIEIKTKGGKVYSKRVDYHFGSPENPMSFDDVASKFKHCCEYSIRPISSGNQDKVISMVKELEQVDDAGEIVHLLA